MDDPIEVWNSMVADGHNVAAACEDPQGTNEILVSWLTRHF
ncbi:hypothetical protein [Prescottella agglutinans]